MMMPVKEWVSAMVLLVFNVSGLVPVRFLFIGMQCVNKREQRCAYVCVCVSLCEKRMQAAEEEEEARNRHTKNEL